MENYALYSFTTATAVYGITIIFSLRKIRLNAINISFVTALALTLFWAAGITYVELNDHLFIQSTLPIESLRNFGWYACIAILINEQHYQKKYTRFLTYWQSYVALSFFLIIIVLECCPDLRNWINNIIQQEIRLYIHVVLSIIGLTIIEQLYRNASLEQHWSVKFLCLALSVMFITDFLVYSKSLLLSHLDFSLWSSRGFINAALAPLLYISFQRLQNKTSQLTISRKLAFHTMMLFCSGIYLIAMSLAGFYIKDFGGEWGEAAQILFITLTVILLLLLFISGKTQANVKVFINKHFFHYNYDYREEWIKLSKTLATLDSLDQLSGFIINTLATLVDSTGGELWLRNENNYYYKAESINARFTIQNRINEEHSTIRFLLKKKWIIDLQEIANSPKKYSDLDYSTCQSTFKNVWILIPLFQQQELIAFVALNDSRVSRQLNWEDIDILGTVGMQLSNALQLCHTSDQLAQSKQFEAYNRLSAYLVHDLKNVVAQISLIVKNAEKHKHNPDFIEDAIATLQNAVDKMQHLVTQLKQGNIHTNTSVIDLVDVAKTVMQQQSPQQPKPELEINTSYCPIQADKNKITSILCHLIQNAQEATEENGFVKLSISTHNDHARIKITDNGIGMDNKFISERLFKPFDTTKGNAGMGIGVYEAQEYINKLSGKINVDSNPGKGTEFSIILPLDN